MLHVPRTKGAVIRRVQLRTHGRQLRQCTSARRRVVLCAVQQYESEVIPPPPPPPPSARPPPSGPDRRQLLGYIAGAVALVVSTAWGVSSFQGKQSDDKLEQMRLKSGFKRERDGHVWLKARDGQWVQLRLDANIPGTLLMRDQRGAVFYLTINNIQQIDLTDDFVVTALFADGRWEGSMVRVQARDDEGQLADLTLDEDDFSTLISVLS